MRDYWVGVRGELTDPQRAKIEGAGLSVLQPPIYSLRDRLGVPVTVTLRERVLVRADSREAAMAEVAELLGLEARDLVAHSAEELRCPVCLTSIGDIGLSHEVNRGQPTQTARCPGCGASLVRNPESDLIMLRQWRLDEERLASD